MVILGGAVPLATLDSLGAKMTADAHAFSVNDGWCTCSLLHAPRPPLPAPRQTPLSDQQPVAVCGKPAAATSGDFDFGSDNTAIGEEGEAGGARKPRDFRGIRPPPFPPHLHRDVIYNAAAVSVSSALLGPEPTLMTYATNSSFPGSAQQGVHADAPFPVLPHHITTDGRAPGFVLNVPLHDFSIENGATIVYPGSHLNEQPTVISSEGDVIQDHRLAQRHAVRPAEQPCPKRGDIIVRDLRLCAFRRRRRRRRRPLPLRS